MFIRLIQFFVGLALCGIASAMLIRSGLGLGPWDVFHQGTAERSGISFGTVLIVTGLVVLLLWIPLRQRPTWATFVNQIIVGLTADLTLSLVAPAQGIALAVALLVGAILIQGFGVAIYIGAGMGPGPRDGLMTGIVGRTGWTIRSVRTGIELSALSIGWVLGGTIGIGTLLYAVSIGPVIHVVLPWFDRRPPRRISGGSGSGDRAREEFAAAARGAQLGDEHDAKAREGL